VLWFIVRWLTFVVPMSVISLYFGHLVSIIVVVIWTGFLLAALRIVLRTAHTVEFDGAGNAVFQSALGVVSIPIPSIRSIDHGPNRLATIVKHTGGEVRVRPEAPGLLILDERMRIAEISGESRAAGESDTSGS
jgi:hypothetical protein